MERLFVVLTLALLVIPAISPAQTFNCKLPNPPAPQVIIEYVPATPNASQPLAIGVAVAHYDPTITDGGGAVAVLQNGSINVTLTAFRLQIATPPPLFCVPALIGPLPAGVYPVNLFLNDTNPDSHQPLPTLVATSTVTVTSVPELVPTLSYASQWLLLLLLSGVAATVILLRRVVV